MQEADGGVEKDVSRSLSNIVPKAAEYEWQHDSNSGHKGGIGMFVQVVGK